jgi:hypothetical protein
LRLLFSGTASRKRHTPSKSLTPHAQHTSGASRTRHMQTVGKRNAVEDTRIRTTRGSPLPCPAPPAQRRYVVHVHVLPEVRSHEGHKA